METKITKGISIIYKREVTAGDTSRDYSSSTLEFLLSTPGIVHMVTEASVKLLDHLVPAGYITVSGRIDISHINPTMVGEKINIILTVEEIQGIKIILDVKVHDSVGLIAYGKHERFITDSSKLMANAYKRLGKA